MSKIAIIQSGGKQYVVEKDSVVTLEKLPSSKDGKVSFEQVLLTDDGSVANVGSPFIDGAKVSGEIVTEGRARKVTVIQYKQKSRYFKKRGHRQPFTKVRITDV